MNCTILIIKSKNFKRNSEFNNKLGNIKEEKKYSKKGHHKCSSKHRGERNLSGMIDLGFQQQLNQLIQVPDAMQMW